MLIGPITDVAGFASNPGHAYAAEDVTGALPNRAADAGLASGTSTPTRRRDRLTLVGSGGEIHTSIFADEDVVVRVGSLETSHRVRNPPHVHQPLIQTIVDELLGRGRCESTGETGARASWVLDRCVEGYYG